MTSEVPLAGYPAVQEYLFGLKAAGIKFGIDRMRIARGPDRQPRAARAVHPCRRAPTARGRSRRCSSRSCARRAGAPGLYTSPHLVRLGERVQVDRQPLTEAEITAYVDELQPFADRIMAKGGIDDRPSFFEFMTAMAFLQFARRRCQFNVIEVGLGGRLDATNVVEPEVCGHHLDRARPLRYAREHARGDRRREGGHNQAGAPGGDRPDAGRRGGHDQGGGRLAGARALSRSGRSSATTWPRTRGQGSRATTSAGMPRPRPSRRAFSVPASGVTLPSIVAGLAEVDWPGRWQRTTIGGRPAVLDASHNPEGAGVLDTNLASLRAETGRRRGRRGRGHGRDARRGDPRRALPPLRGDPPGRPEAVPRLLARGA